MFKDTVMTKRSLFVFPLLSALALGGCGASTYRGLEPLNQPVVTRGDYLFDVATTGRGLSPVERQRLAGWMGSLRLGYGDKVTIDDPVGDPAARDDVANVVARYGLLLSDERPVTSAAVTPGTIRVVITRMHADVPTCPDYTHMEQPEFESATSSDFGCAVNTNLARMVANPADLVRGQVGSETSDTASATKAIAAFRAATPSGGGGATVKSDSTGGGK